MFGSRLQVIPNNPNACMVYVCFYFVPWNTNHITLGAITRSSRLGFTTSSATTGRKWKPPSRLSASVVKGWVLDCKAQVLICVSFSGQPQPGRSPGLSRFANAGHEFHCGARMSPTMSKGFPAQTSQARQEVARPRQESHHRDSQFQQLATCVPCIKMTNPKQGKEIKAEYLHLFVVSIPYKPSTQVVLGVTRN